MISPLEVVEHVIEYYRKNKHEIGLSQVEGFVRQIVGWREYMRGIYWTQMPEYKKNNRLKDNQRIFYNTFRRFDMFCQLFQKIAYLVLHLRFGLIAIKV